MIIREKDLELYHHGVKGMKWGQRRALYKNMKKYERDVTFDKTSQSFYKKAKNLENKYAKSNKYSNKTEKQIDNLYSEASEKSKKYVNNKLLQKYGKEKVNQYTKHKEKMLKADQYIIGAGLLGTAVGTVLAYKGAKKLAIKSIKTGGKLASKVLKKAIK